jgi:hypothetical protein
MRALALDAKQIPIAPAGALAPQRFELDARALDEVAEPARFRATGASRAGRADVPAGLPVCSGVCARLRPVHLLRAALRSGDGLRLLAPGARFTAAASCWRVAHSANGAAS